MFHLIGGALVGVTVQVINCVFVMQIFGENNAKNEMSNKKSPTRRLITISTDNVDQERQNENIQL